MNKSQVIEFQKSHGLHGFQKTHGQIHTRAYSIWHSMRSRCTNPNSANFQYYGAKGISVCDQWAYSFETFLADMGHPPEGMTLDRIDSKGNYEPANCRWATRREQNNNRTFNRQMTLNGETRNVSQWAEFLDIGVATLFTRIRRGWSDEKALTVPTRRYAKEIK